MSLPSLALGFLVSFVVLPAALADLPVHCVRHQIAGEWHLTLGKASEARKSCGHERPDTRMAQPPRSLVDSEIETSIMVSLQNPNRAVTAEDQRGTWTMIYDEGFEINTNDLSFIAFSNFTWDAKKHNISHCDQTMVGWYHNLNRTRFGCFYGSQLVDRPMANPVEWKMKEHVKPTQTTYDTPLDAEKQKKAVRKLNARLGLFQSSWRAKPAEKWNGRTMREVNHYVGLSRPSPGKDMHHQMLKQKLHAPRSFLQTVSPTQFPVVWDWSNVSGVNYLEPVMDQGDCGSCYAASSVHMLSARHKIAIKNASATPWSISFPLFCSEYNQGCDGGYGFLLSRWSEDVGLLPATCMRYKTAGSCSLECDLSELQGKRYRVANHRYVGSYYGRANEALMMQELYHNGPLAVGIEPDDDFMYYSDGVFKSHSPKSTSSQKEWEQVDHGVLLVGWGEADGQKYWKIQNSWGPDWGEDGFFRIVRGVDDSAIESMAEAADVVEDEQNGQRVNELFQQIGANIHGDAVHRKKPLKRIPFGLLGKHSAVSR